MRNWESREKENEGEGIRDEKGIGDTVLCCAVLRLTD